MQVYAREGWKHGFVFRKCGHGIFEGVSDKPHAGPLLDLKTQARKPKSQLIPCRVEGTIIACTSVPLNVTKPYNERGMKRQRTFDFLPLFFVSFFGPANTSLTDPGRRALPCLVTLESCKGQVRAAKTLRP